MHVWLFQYKHPKGRVKNCGAGGRTRTPDLLITNQLLYQLSYTSIGASDENRTRVSSLEGWRSTIELHLHIGLPGKGPGSVVWTESAI